MSLKRIPIMLIAALATTAAVSCREDRNRTKTPEEVATAPRTSERNTVRDQSAVPRDEKVTRDQNVTRETTTGSVGKSKMETEPGREMRTQNERDTEIDRTRMPGEPSPPIERTPPPTPNPGG